MNEFQGNNMDLSSHLNVLTSGIWYSSNKYKFPNMQLKSLEESLGINLFSVKISDFPANIYLFKLNNRNTRKRCEVCSKLTIKTSESYLWFSNVSRGD